MAAKKIAVGGGTRAVVESPVIPESSIHADPQEPQRDWSQLTINGGPIPEALWPTMRYRYTDQGMQEANGGVPVEGKPVDEILARLSGTDEVVKAAYAIVDAERRGLPRPAEAAAVLARAATSQGVGEGAAVERFKDGRKASNLVLGSDPLQHAIDTFTPPGHHGMMMGDLKASKSGLVRGVLKYEPVLVLNPDTGRMERVQQGGMFLASVPQEHKDEEQAYYRDLNESKAKQSTEAMQEAANKLGPQPSRRTGFQGIEVEDATAAEMELDSKFATVGLPE